MKKCPRVLDKPIILWGIEIEDVAVLASATGVAAILFDPTIPFITLILGWIILANIKKDQPRGIVFHLLYKVGIFQWPGLIISPKKVSRYCMYRKNSSRNEGNMDDMDPQKSKFVVRYANAESSGVIKNWSLGLAGIIIVVLIIALVKVSTKPKDSYYFSSFANSGIAVPNQVPESMITGLATHWVLERYNFTPATFDDAVKFSEKYMTPRFLSKFRAKVKEERHYVENARISSTFKTIIDQDPIIEKKKGGFLVTLSGHKHIFMGKEEVLIQEVLCKIFLKVSPPTEKNKWGLQVDDERQEIIKEGS